MPLCPYCRTVASEDYQFCPECGRPLATGEVVVGGRVEGKSRKKLAGIIIACIVGVTVIAIIATRTPTYTLSTGVSPSGTGFISPSGGDYASGAQVTLTAYPTSGYTFDHWSGSTYGTTSTISIAMDSDTSLTAHFKTIPTVPQVLFTDDFSHESGGWFTYDEASGRSAYLNGYLYIKDYTGGGSAFGDCLDCEFTDFILEVRTWLLGGTDNNWHGVLC